MARKKKSGLIEQETPRKNLSLEYRMKKYPLSIPVVRSEADHSGDN